MYRFCASAFFAECCVCMFSDIQLLCAHLAVCSGKLMQSLDQFCSMSTSTIRSVWPENWPEKVLEVVLPTCSVLQDLAMKQLLQNQVLPYLIAGPAAVSVAVDRASRVMAELSTVKGLIQGQCCASQRAVISTVDRLARTPVISHGLWCLLRDIV